MTTVRLESSPRSRGAVIFGLRSRLHGPGVPTGQRWGANNAELGLERLMTFYSGTCSPTTNFCGLRESRISMSSSAHHLNGAMTNLTADTSHLGTLNVTNRNTPSSAQRLTPPPLLQVQLHQPDLHPDPSPDCHPDLAHRPCRKDILSHTHNLFPV